MINYIKTHVFYLVLIAAGLIFIRAWQSEHDQRVLADAAIKSSNQTITSLQQEMAANDSRAASQIAAARKAVAAIKTPTQVVAAIPQLSDIPLNARVIPGNPTDVTVAALPLAQVLEQSKELSVSLGACQSDLKNEQAINLQYTDQIKVLKKKPSFLHRVVHTLEIVGIGIGIGVALVH